MAAYEILLLNTAIPQIQAAQSGDTYVVPRDIAFSTVANLANGTNLLPSLTFSSDTNTGIYREGADALGFTAGGGTNQMVLTSTGLGIGTNNPAYKLDVVGTGSIISATRSDTNRADIIVTNSGGTVSFGINNSTGSWLTNGLPYYGYILGPSSASYGLQFGVGTSNTAALTIDPSGNLGLGVTPSAWWSGMKALQVGSGAALYDFGSSNVAFGSNLYFDGTNSRYINTDFASYYQQNNGIHIWATAPSGTANSASVTSGASYTVVALGSSTLAQWQAFFNDSSNNPLTVTPTIGQVLTGNATGTLLGGGLVTQNISFTQAMTLLANGNLGVGETNPAAKLQVAGGNIRLDNNQGIEWGGGTNFIYGNNSTNILVFTTSNTERARITSGGYFKASNTGTYQSTTSTYHELRNDANTNTVRISNTIASGYTDAVSQVSFTGYSPNDGTAVFLWCNDTTTVRAKILSDGGLANYSANDVNLSDRREKTNFAPAKSYLNTICAIPVQTFNYIDQSENDPGLTLGVVAQDVQAVAPELVTESNWGTKDDPKMRLSIYQTDLQYALMKCIQELKSELDSVKAELATLKGA